MSLRKIAKELGVSHTLLSVWKQGKRNLSPELEKRYHELVTTGYRDNNSTKAKNGLKMVGVVGIEPTTSCSQSKRLSIDLSTPV